MKYGPLAYALLACFAAGVALVVLALVPGVIAQRRRAEAIDCLKQLKPAQWEHLQREGGRQALLQWASKDPDLVEDDELREALQRADRMQRIASRMAIAGFVLAGSYFIAVLADNPAVGPISLPGR